MNAGLTLVKVATEGPTMTTSKPGPSPATPADAKRKATRPNDMAERAVGNVPKNDGKVEGRRGWIGQSTIGESKI